MREQPDLLDDVADAAAQLRPGPCAVTSSPSSQDRAGGRLDQPVDHPQRGGLAAARRADQHARSRRRRTSSGQSCDRDRAVGVSLLPSRSSLIIVSPLVEPVIEGVDGEPPTSGPSAYRCGSELPAAQRMRSAPRSTSGSRSAELVAGTTEHLRITLISGGRRAVIAPARWRSWPAGSGGLAPARPRRLDGGSTRFRRSRCSPCCCRSPGLSERTVVIGLVLYSLTILVRAVLSGLDGVPEEVRDAGRGMGYSTKRPAVAGRAAAGPAGAHRRPAYRHRLDGGPHDDRHDRRQRRPRGPHQHRPEQQLQGQVLTASVLCVVLALVLDVSCSASSGCSCPGGGGGDADGLGGGRRRLVRGSAALAGPERDPAAPARARRRLGGGARGSPAPSPSRSRSGSATSTGAAGSPSSVSNVGRAVPTYAVLVVLVLMPGPVRAQHALDRSSPSCCSPSRRSSPTPTSA